MKIERIVNFETDQNCYLVFDEDKNGFLVDPGSKSEEILRVINELGVKVLAIFLTHCHYDHIEGLNDLRNKINVKVYSTFECSNNIQKPSVNLSILFGDSISCEPSDVIVLDNDIINIASMKIKVITTPGHTNGGACFLVDEDIFTGDTLFLRSVGRWDFPGGNEEILKNSIKNKLYTLDDDIIVHPGHGNDTKIYYEKRYNMFVKGE